LKLVGEHRLGCGRQHRLVRFSVGAPRCACGTRAGH
jgi:hypothetical protein